METTVIGKKSRETWIDFCKFLGILFVLMNHVDLKIPLISRFGGLFYVPVFFVLSGYTYHLRDEKISVFIKRKAKRLLIPYFGYNIFLFLFFFIKDDVLKGTIGWHSVYPLLGILYSRNSLYRDTVTPNHYFFTILNSPTWFLTALFLSIILFDLCVRLVHDNLKQLCMINLLFAAVGLVISYLTPVLLPWSLDTILIFELFLTSGYVLRKKKECIKIKNSKITYVISLALLYILAIYNGSANISIGDYGRSVSVGILLSILSSVWVILFSQKIQRLIPAGVALIGEHSLILMCLHMFLFMFIKTGFNFINPQLLSGGTTITTLAKSMMVAATLAILTCVEIAWDLARGRKVR